MQRLSRGVERGKTSHDRGSSISDNLSEMQSMAQSKNECRTYKSLNSNWEKNDESGKFQCICMASFRLATASAAA